MSVFTGGQYGKKKLNNQELAGTIRTKILPRNKMENK